MHAVFFAAGRYDSFTEAGLWERLAKQDAAGVNYVRCGLCRQECQVAPGKYGQCGVRYNHQGSFFTAVGANVAAVNLDPVEKKPLFHFLPGTATFSIGTLGCNLHCRFCQNSDISQPFGSSRNPGRKADAWSIVKAALESGARSISYTYNEPVVFFELMRETASLAIEHGLRNIMVSNAFMSEGCFSELNGLIHAVNFDLKSFTNDFYRKICGARLEPVLENIKVAVKAGWWVELTTLVIPDLNDSMEELSGIASFIAHEAGRQVPWHVSRFHPSYKMLDTTPTGLDALERALEAGCKAGLDYVYVGNLPGHESESTFCPSCKEVVLERRGYRTRVNARGRCPKCATVIAGVWE